MKVPFARADITRAEEKAVLAVLRSGWITSGPKMVELEEGLSTYLGCKVQVIAVNSCTVGLHLALEALGIGPGDEVLVPTMTFTATAEVVRYLGAMPVFVDIDEKTLNVDLVDAEQRLTPRTKMIMPVHFGGLPCDVFEVGKFAYKYGLKIVEDAAHALGSTYGGVPIGAVGPADAVVFSFYATKCITTAEGGAIVLKQDSKLGDRIKKMRLHGMNKDAINRYTGGSWEYDVIAPGFKDNMPDVLAAIGVEQLKRADQMKAVRQGIARWYDRELVGWVRVPEYRKSSCCHLYVVRVAKRNEFIERMKELDIECSVHFKPLHRMTYWKDYVQGVYPVADKVFTECVSLPIYSKMTDVQIRHVIKSVKQCAEEGLS